MEMELEKYTRMALDMGAVDALAINVADIVFDPRTYLKCAWGCDEFGQLKCSPDLIKPWEAEPLLRRYGKALLIHTHAKELINDIAWEVERAAFLDGNYFAFALYDCNGCEVCEASSRRDCPHPEKSRPGDDFVGIDVFATVRKFGLPIEVLTDREQRQNRYSFVFIT
jgi:predicted metal-binding protein